MTGLFSKPNRQVDRVFIHCSANSNEVFSGTALYEFIRHIHVNQNRWSDIGYHFMIDRKGEVIKGRDIERSPAAQRGHNTGTIAIMVHGGQGSKDDFTLASLMSLRSLCAEINEAYQRQITFHGHCEVSNKACPVFDYRKELGLDLQGKMSR